MGVKKAMLLGLVITLMSFLLGFVLALNYQREQPLNEFKATTHATKTSQSKVNPSLEVEQASTSKQLFPTTIKDILLLPTEFQQTEALYKAA